jgi:hypothetical protein
MPRRSKPKKSKNAPTQRGRVKGGWSKVADNIKQRFNEAAREAAVAIMNDLARKGPAFSGDFRDSWQAIAVTGGTTSPTPTGYPYTLSDVPELNLRSKTLNTVRIFEIVNTSPYALYAMDIIPGTWRKPKGAQPIGGIEFGVKTGKRKFGESFRGEIDTTEEGEGVSTAKADWYENYIRGGELSKEFKRAVGFAFRSAGNGNIKL